MQKNTLHRFKKALPAGSTRSDLEGLVKDSSDKVRQFFFAYLALITYVLAVVFATTDKQLLLVNEGLKLPIVDITVPLIGFYVVIPMFVLGLHFNLLQNLASHHFKLMELQRAWKGTVPSERINASMFDLAVLKKHGVMLHWVRGINSLLCLYSGPIALTVVLWRFADYQSSWILLEHTLLLWVDLYLLSRTHEAFSENIKQQVTTTAFSTSKKIIKFIADFAFAPSTFLPRKIIFLIISIPITLILSLKLLVCWNVFGHDLINDSESDRAIIFKTPEYFINNDSGWIIPKISIDKTNDLISIDINKLSTKSLLMGRRDWQTYFQERGISLDIRNRSLRYLDLQFQVLPRLNAEYSKLQGSNFSFAELDGSNFGYAHLEGANFSFTKLRGAYLHFAQMQGIELSHARLQGAFMESSELQGANLFDAHLQGAFLSHTQFQGAELENAKLNGSFLSDTNIWGAFDTPRTISIIDINPSDIDSMKFTKPTKYEFNKWAISIIDTESQNAYWERMEQAVTRSMQTKPKIDINDKIASFEIVKNLCHSSETSAVAMRAILEKSILMRLNINDLLADAINTKPECAFLKSKLTFEIEIKPKSKN